MPEVEETVVVGSPLGLHGRPAAEIVRLASPFRAELSLSREDGSGNRADCRSILAMLVLAATCGTRLVLRGVGEDAETAVKTVAAYFAGNFNE